MFDMAEDSTESSPDAVLILEANASNGEAIGSKGPNDLQDQRLCYKHRLNPCHLWSVFCCQFLRLLKIAFGKLGESIATRPLIFLVGCILFVSLCSTGLLRLEIESRTEKLFIPQESRAIEDLNMAERFFPLKVRKEGIILVGIQEHSNVLQPDCLQEAFSIHNQIMQLNMYSDYCLTLSGDKADSLDECVTLDPFEIFLDKKFNNKTLFEIQKVVTMALGKGSMKMRNGQLFAFNFKQIFGAVKRNEEDGFITGARALRLHYLFRDPTEDYENKQILKWEKNFLQKASSLSPSCFEVYYEAERSTDDAIKENSNAEKTLVSITFIVMISFACLMLSKFLNPLTGHSLLAGAGVLAVSLGILAGMAIASLCGVTFVNMVGVVPYLVISVGIDDMFILAHELDRIPRRVGVVQTIKEVMSRTGATITMTTMTDLVAFAVSTSTSFPAIR